VEFWFKNADRCAYIEDGEVKTELLRRVGCERASIILMGDKCNKSQIKKALLNIADTSTILQVYTNPVDRYCSLIKHPELLKDIEYLK
jgi:hypothetical protein